MVMVRRPRAAPMRASDPRGAAVPGRRGTGAPGALAAGRSRRRTLRKNLNVSMPCVRGCARSVQQAELVRRQSRRVSTERPAVAPRFVLNPPIVTIPPSWELPARTSMARSRAHAPHRAPTTLLLRSFPWVPLALSFRRSLSLCCSDPVLATRSWPELRLSLYRSYLQSA